MVNRWPQKKEEEREKRNQRRVEELEQAIAGLEERISRLEEELYLPEVYQDFQAYQQRQDELEQTRTALQGHMEEWLTLIEE